MAEPTPAVTTGSPVQGELVAPGIIAVETSTADGKIGAILGRRVALGVDAGIDAGEGQRLAAAVRDLGRAPDRLVYTHAHLDHVLGGESFIGGEVYAHQDAAAHIARQVPAWATRYERTETAIAESIAWPTVRFNEPLALDLGGREVVLLPTPGHAPGATCIHVPDVGVLFGGDTVVTGILPSFKDGDSGQMASTLRELASLAVETLVPGHGPVLRGRETIRDAMVWSADYLDRCRDHVSSMIGREPAEVIVAAAPFERFVGDRLPPDRHRMTWRHEQTILMIIDQLAARPA